MIDVILGVGSNRTWQGIDSISILKSACMCLKSLLSEFCVSSVYRTKPMYVKDQNDFYNMVVRGKIDKNHSPFQLLDDIHGIEAQFGRNRDNEIRNGPRSLDIDIEFFGNQIINTKDLQIPHPRINERPFVLIPMLELLKDSADFINKDEYLLYAKKADSSGVELIMSAQEFLS